MSQTPQIDPLAILTGAALQAAASDIQRQQIVACHEHVAAVLKKQATDIEQLRGHVAALTKEGQKP